MHHWMNALLLVETGAEEATESNESQFAKLK